MVGFPSDGTVVSSVTGTTALGLSAVWRCLDILSNGVSQLPWREKRGTLELPPSRLVQRPLSQATRRDWTSYVVSSLALYDVAYLWKVGGTDAEGVPIGLWPICPSYITTMQTSSPVLPFISPDEYYIGSMQVSRDELVILRRSPQPGLSEWQSGVLQAARIKFAEVLAADAFSSRFWQGGGHVNNYLTTEAALNDSEAMSLSDRWATRRSRGPDHVPVMSSGLHLEQTGADPTQQAAVEARKELVADIGRYFGVPDPHPEQPPGRQRNLQQHRVRQPGPGALHAPELHRGHRGRDQRSAARRPPPEPRHRPAADRHLPLAGAGLPAADRRQGGAGRG